MIFLLLAVIAAIHRVKDGIEERFSDTIFSSKNEKFWNPAVSKKSGNKYLDAEGLLRMSMTALVILSIVLGSHDLFRIKFIADGWYILICIIVYVSSYNLTGKYYLFKKKK